SLPWWARYFFRATKFHDDRRDLWFCPFESASNPTYRPRRAYLEGKVEQGDTREDVRRIAQLLLDNADDEALAHGMVQVVNRPFVGREVPRPVTKAAKYTLQGFAEAIFPWKYRKARRSREQVLEFCEANLEPGVHVLDVGHNIGEVVQSTAGALRRLKDNPGGPVEVLFTNHPPTLQVPRVAVKPSRLGGLLWGPPRPGWAGVVPENGRAATRTHDLLFTFGTGRPERACVFMSFFLAFMRDLQKELQAAGAHAQAPASNEQGGDSSVPSPPSL